MAYFSDLRRPGFAGAEETAIRGANNRDLRNAAVAAADKLIHPQA